MFFLLSVYTVCVCILGTDLARDIGYCIHGFIQSVTVFRSDSWLEQPGGSSRHHLRAQEEQEYTGVSAVSTRAESVGAFCFREEGVVVPW